MPGNYQQVDKEIRGGRLWRAREMLQVRVNAAAYDPELFERFAQVLSRIGDQDEAGRYYFLSGATSAEARVLAEAFLQRRARWSLTSLWRTMPNAARRIGAGGVPKRTLDDLAMFGGGYDKAANFVAGCQTRHGAGQSSLQDGKLDQALSRTPQVLRAEFGGVALIVGLAVVFLVGVIACVGWLLRVLGLA